MSDIEINGRVEDSALDTLFRQARTHTAWRDEPVTEDLLRAVYDLAKWGPTSANASPARIVFLVSEEAKNRLLPCLAQNNVEKSRTAAAVAIVAFDLEFYEQLDRLYPHANARTWFEGNDAVVLETAFRNSSLQGAYLMLAARALGLDCGPMSGFDAEKVNAEFFPDGKWRVNFLFNLGYGDATKLRPRNPRLEFEEACRIL